VDCLICSEFGVDCLICSELGVDCRTCAELGIDSDFGGDCLPCAEFGRDWFTYAEILVLTVLYVPSLVVTVLHAASWLGSGYQGVVGGALEGRHEPRGPLLTGVPRSYEIASPSDPAVGICLGPCGGPRGGGCFL